eukprot:NODE_5189_length_707_cov_25.279635_g4821_i0.p1 GENE.NODE_5189_length_707_cov_25.279635_g4821_i0~~NODE_5189_length_707_cov_25.279635_g4821_i0.p1  ORF type:complete len:188 (+),score=34.28 NODE_5189_length_707_cov_25.279635_g4821_i0:83-565(+)
MSPYRQSLVYHVYDLLDQNSDDVVSFDKIKATFDVHSHPEVLSKEKTAQEAMIDFLKGWDKNGDNEISREEFADYYADISAAIDEDEEFETMLRNTWHVDIAERALAGTSGRRALVIHHDGTQTIEEIRGETTTSSADTMRPTHRLARQGVTNTKAVLMY